MSATRFDHAVAWDASLVGWTVKSYELVRQVLLDPARFTSEGGAIADNLMATARRSRRFAPIPYYCRKRWRK
jgi:hypothetical protein